MHTDITGITYVAAVGGATAVPDVATVIPVLDSEKCALCLKVAPIAYHYYASIGSAITPVNMNYTNVLKGLNIKYGALITISKDTKPAVLIESFKYFLFCTYCFHHWPLLYVVWEDDAFPNEADDPLVAGYYYGALGSVLDELIACLDHTDTLYKFDNAIVYSLLEEATHRSIYATKIKPYARRKSWRSAWASMVSSHAGQDKWEELQKTKSKFLMNTKCNGHTFILENFTGLHKSSFVQLQEAAEHIYFQLPTEHTRVGYLLDKTQNNNPNLRAANAIICINNNGMI